MCAAGDCGDVIILSDEDDEVVCSGPGVDVGEEEKKNNGTSLYMTLYGLCCVWNSTYCSSSSSSAPNIGSAEDMVVTFSRRPELLPHARHDCPLHLFTQVSPLVYFSEKLSWKFSSDGLLLFLSFCVLLRATDGAVQGPVADNHLFCEKCFCFICDKPASAVRVRPVTVSDSRSFICLLLTPTFTKSSDGLRGHSV